MINFGKTSHRIAFAALLTAASVGVAQAVTSTAFIYSTAKTGYYAIDSADMHPESSSVQYLHEGFNINPTGTTQGCFYAGVHLPNGATITQLAVYYKSGVAAGGQPLFDLRRKRFSDGMLTSIGNRTFIDNGGVRRAALVPIDATAAVVNNLQYSYQLLVCLYTSNDVFYQARLGYTYTNAGD